MDTGLKDLPASGRHPNEQVTSESGDEEQQGGLVLSQHQSGAVVGAGACSISQDAKDTRHYVLLQPLWRTVWRLLKKLKTELPYDPAIPLLGIYLYKTIIKKNTHAPYAQSSTIRNSQDMEAT